MQLKELNMLSKKLISTTILAVSIVLLQAAAVLALDGNEILTQVDRNLQPETYEMYRKLINIEPDGSKKEFVLYSVKKGSDKMVALFLSPASEKGRSTLHAGCPDGNSQPLGA